jgi:hypothetical protein
VESKKSQKDDGKLNRLEPCIASVIKDVKDLAVKIIKRCSKYRLWIKWIINQESIIINVF